MVAQNHDGAWLGISSSVVSSAVDADDHAIFYLGLSAQRGFQVLGVNVEASRSDDDFFLAALEIEIAGCVEGADVSGAIPALIAGKIVAAGTVPVAGGDAATAHQNLAVRGQLELPAGQHFPDRALAQPEGVIHADQRRRLRQAISLDSGVAESSPEFFGFRVERRTAANEGQKFPSELATDIAEDPPTAQKVLALGGAVPLLKLVPLALLFFASIFFALVFQIALNLLFE